MTRERRHPREHRTARERPARWLRAATSTLALLLLGGLTQVVGGPATAAAARAAARPAAGADSPDRVSVQIETVSPAALTPTGTLVVQGLVTNTGPDPLTGVFIRLRYRYKLLESRADLQKWSVGESALTADANEPKGTRVVLSGPLAGHAGVPFRFTVAAKELNLPVDRSVFGTRGLMVDTFAELPGQGTKKVGAAYTFLVWDPLPAQRYTKLTVLAPITSAQAQPDAAAPTSALVTAMAPGGRLDRLAATVHGSGISWAIDPALLDAARRAQTPTRTATPTPSTPTPAPSTPTPTPSTPAPSTPARTPAHSSSGNTEPTIRVVPGASATAPTRPSGGNGAGGPESTTEAQAAATWLTTVTGTASTNRPLVLPFADPDLTALAHNGGGGLLDLARSQGDESARQVFGSGLRSSIAWPADGRADSATVGMLTGTPWQGIVLASAAQPPATAVRTTPTGRSSVPREGTPLSGLLSDDVLSGLLGDLGTARLTGAQTTLIQQRLLAELATITVERPDDTRHLLVTTPRNWDPDPTVVTRVLGEVTGAPWVQLKPVDDLLAAQPSPVPRAELQYPAKARDAELPKHAVAAVVSAQISLTKFSPVLTRPQDLMPDLQRQAVSLVGTAWRGHGPAELAAARAPWQARIRGVLDSVTVLSGDANLLSHSGRLPVTVHNELDQPVRVQLVVKPRSGLLRLGNRKPFVIGPHGNHTVLIPFRAAGNGKVQVEATLWSSPAGEEPVFHAPFEVRVHSNWESIGLIVAGSLLGVLVLLGLARSIRRGRTALPPESAPDPDELLARQESGRRAPSVFRRLLGGGDHPSRGGPTAGNGTDDEDNRTDDADADVENTTRRAGERPGRRTP